jgi:hypothetical protein
MIAAKIYIKVDPFCHNLIFIFPYTSCSGSTIVGIGSPDPPQFIYDEDEYQDVFVSGKALVVLP